MHVICLLCTCVRLNPGQITHAHALWQPVKSTTTALNKPSLHGSEELSAFQSTDSCVLLVYPDINSPKTSLGPFRRTT